MGDQILVCDGISMINVSHNEAAQALKRAMDMESVSGLHHSDVIEVSIYACMTHTVATATCPHASCLNVGCNNHSWVL